MPSTMNTKNSTSIRPMLTACGPSVQSASGGFVIPGRAASAATRAPRRPEWPGRRSISARRAPVSCCIHVRSMNWMPAHSRIRLKASVSALAAQIDDAAPGRRQHQLEHLDADVPARRRHQRGAQHDSPEHQAAHQLLGPEQRLVQHVAEEHLQQDEHEIAGQQRDRDCSQRGAQNGHRAPRRSSGRDVHARCWKCGRRTSGLARGLHGLDQRLALGSGLARRSH